MMELYEALKNKNVILFVGAGISMNLGLPSWSKLIDYIADELGYEPEVFNTFGDNLSLAEYYEIKKVLLDHYVAGWIGVGIVMTLKLKNQKFIV